jgi:DNA-binding transcriptional regulator YiaG
VDSQAEPVNPTNVRHIDLAAVRRAAGLSQVDLAQRWGCSRQFVQQLERRQRRIPRRKLAALLELVAECAKVGPRPE